MSQQDPLEALQLQSPVSTQCHLELPDSIAYGSVSVGGFIACALAKYAVSYAAQHAKAKAQTDVRSSSVQFYRPVLPRKGTITMMLHEISIGRAWSTFRVDAFQGDASKLATSATITITDFATPGVTINTAWQLLPPARTVDLCRLETDDEPNWACYHTAFRPDGFRRAYASVKNYIPKQWPRDITFIDQWIMPGWDCTPFGSKSPSAKPARWTNELIQFAADLNLPIQENLAETRDGALPLGSIAATLNFAAQQEKARKAGVTNWRELSDDGSLEEDGSKAFKHSLVHATLSMTTEIKRSLPEEGVRWLMLRTDFKTIRNGRMDQQVLIFDEELNLIAISQHVLQIIKGTAKSSRSSSL